MVKYEAIGNIIDNSGNIIGYTVNGTDNTSVDMTISDIKEKLLNGATIKRLSIDKHGGVKFNTNNLPQNLIGMQFGDWKVLEYAGNRMWKCECQCQLKTVKNVAHSSLLNGMSTSCRHPLRSGNEVFEGARINYWKVGKKLGYGLWDCECICGKHRKVNISSLRYGYSKSCGCKQGEAQRETLLEFYDEVVTNKQNDSRLAWQIDAVSSRESMFEYLQSLDEVKTPKQLSELLGINKSAVLKNIHKYKLEEYIDLKSFSSNSENTLYEYITSIYDGDIRKNDKSTINPFELDVYIPELRLAIEFNGNYWHSTMVKEEKYHQHKYLRCRDKGIRLIQVFEYEWADEDSRDKIKNYIKNILNTSETIYARNTELFMASDKEASAFIGENHLQGYVKASVNVGLKYKNEIVAMMTFSGSRYDKNYDCELIRLCYKQGVNVVGGAEKMFKCFTDRFSVRNVLSYCDVSKFVGSIYSRLNFKEVKLTEPNYVWASSDEVLSRQKTMKHKLVELGYSKDKTENEIMSERGYLKIYDCGNLKFVWERK